jgi:chloramphenicol-sensitive protein RarD
MKSSPGNARLGFLSAVVAFLLWGILPLFWNQISFIPPVELIGHRVLWGGLLATAITLIRYRDRMSWSVFFPSGKLRWLLIVNGCLVVTNWLVFVWAVTSGRTLDASLGYYINPLVSIFLGMIFFNERLVPWHWVALLLALTGVVVLTLHAGVFPWASLTLAFTFGFYGLIKKKMSLPPVHSLAAEILTLLIPAVLLLSYLEVTGAGHFFRSTTMTQVYLLMIGVVTVAPLVFFGVAAAHIRLADVGFLQYIAPTGMFLIALFVFQEPFDSQRLTGFGFVWLALIVYTLPLFLRRPSN